MSASKGLVIGGRLLALIGLWAFVGMGRNPIVRLEALLGVSPSPLERLLGVRGPFSGMTEGFFQLSHLHVEAALRANILTPLVALSLVCVTLMGYRPRVRNRRHEIIALCLLLSGSAIVNIFN